MSQGFSGVEQMDQRAEQVGQKPSTTVSAPVMIAAAVLVGLVLRLLFLGSKSIWLDEAMSIGFAERSAQLLSGSFDHSHPPLYYILLHYWLPLGRTESLLRLSSALVGTLAIPLSYGLAHALGGRKVAQTTLWLTALSPLLVWYSQELRSYSLLATLGLVVALAFVHLITRPHVGWWLLFVLVMSASIYTHYAAFLLLPAQLALLVVLYVQRRITRKGLLYWLMAWPVVLLLYGPWLVSPGMQAFTGLIFTERFYPVELISSQLSISPLAASMILIATLVVGMAVALLLGFWLARRESSVWERWVNVPMVRYGALLFFLLATVVSVVPRLYTIKKLVIVLWPLGLLAVAWLFPWKRVHRLTLAIMLAASLIGSLVNVTVVPKDQWREMATYLRQHSEPTDAIWVLPRYHGAPLRYYLDYPDTPDENTSFLATIDLPNVTGAMNDSNLAELAGDNRRIWLISHAVNVTATDPTRRVERWLNEHYEVVDELHLYRIDVTLYAPR
jgi:hypothetical protein